MEPSTGKDRDRFNFAFIVDIANQNIKLSVPNDEIELAEWVNFEDVAARSGNKASYIKIQEALLNPASREVYTEVHPTN